MWTPHLAKDASQLRDVLRVGSDQEPLWALVRSRCAAAAPAAAPPPWTLAALPPAFNARFLRPGRGSALDDDVLIIHDNAIARYGSRSRSFNAHHWNLEAVPVSYTHLTLPTKA